MEDWKVKIYERPGMLMSDIYIYRRTYDGKVIPYNSKVEVLTDGSSLMEPTFSVPTHILPAILAEITKHDVRNPDESFTEGKLKATERHLEDMRQLVFKGNQPGPRPA